MGCQAPEPPMAKEPEATSAFPRYLPRRRQGEVGALDVAHIRFRLFVPTLDTPHSGDRFL